MGFVTRLMDAAGVLRKGAVGPLIDDSRIWKSLRLQAGDSSVTQPYAQSVWVYAAVKAISDNLSQIPFQLGNKEKGSEEFKITEEGPLFDLFQNPNPYMSGEALFEATYTYMNLKGEAFWILDDRSDITKVPKEIWVFDPSRFEAMNDKNTGVLLGWKYKGKQSVTFSVNDVIHFKYFNPYDDIRGLAPLAAVRMGVEQDYFSSLYNTSFFKEGAVVGGFITTDKALNDTQYNRLVHQFEERHKGVQKAHKIGILEGGAQFKDAKITQRDMEFIKLKKLTREEIFAAYKINSVVLGLYEDIKSYEGIKTAHRTFWQECLVPKSKYVQNHLNSKFFSKIDGGKVKCRFDLAQVEALQEDFKDKLESAEKLFNLSYPVNAINKRLGLGMEDVDWGDEKPVQSQKPEVALEATGGEKDEKALAQALNPVVVPMLTEGENAAEQEKVVLALTDETNEVEPVVEKNFLTPAEDLVWRSFLVRQTKVERAFVSKLKKFFFQQRSRVLAELSLTIKRDLTDMVFFAEDETKKLSKLLAPIYEVSVQAGAEGISEELGMTGFAYNPLDAEYLGVMQMKLMNIPPTVIGTLEKQLRKTLIAGVTAGESVVELADRVRGTYNMASSRALMIARTETASAINAGRVVEMRKQGVTKHKWVTAGDEVVRESHKRLNGSVASLGVKFPYRSGGISTLRFPGDPGAPAGEVINCRCVALPACVSDSLGKIKGADGGGDGATCWIEGAEPEELPIKKEDWEAPMQDAIDDMELKRMTGDDNAPGAFYIDDEYEKFLKTQFGDVAGKKMVQARFEMWLKWSQGSSGEYSSVLKSMATKLNLSNETIFHKGFLNRNAKLLKKFTSESVEGMKNLARSFSLREDQIMSLMKMEYKWSQAVFKKMGKRTIKLYRGVDANFFKSRGVALPKIEAEGKAVFNSLSSFSDRRAKAKKFGEYVYEIDVPVEDIIFSDVSSRGLYNFNEGEHIILGKEPLKYKLTSKSFKKKIAEDGGTSPDRVQLALYQKQMEYSRREVDADIDVIFDFTEEEVEWLHPKKKKKVN